jgi:molecular chaperone HscA
VQTPVRLAVDLGTTHTVAVVGRDGQEPRSLIFDGSPLLPSGVFLDAAGALHAGRDAQRLAASEPERFEPHPKRRIDDGTVLLGDREVPVEELLAAALRRVAEEAAASGLRPTETVLTCPADWGPVRRAVLERAADLAAMPDPRLLPEPIAAASYCAEVLGRDLPVGAAVAIFDFGGGTFDTAVVRRADDGRLRTLAVGGLDDLGGLDVDMALAAHLGRIVAGRDPELWQRLSEPETTADMRDRLAFWGEVRAAKEMLSRTSTAPVALPGHNPMGLHLTRDELNSLADPLVARAVDETRRTLERAGVEPASLTALLLVGGSSRMPTVATRLHGRLGVAPSVPEQPELPVAFGALRHALTEPDFPAVTTPMPSPPVSPVSPVTYVPLPPPGGAPTPAMAPGGGPAPHGAPAPPRQGLPLPVTPQASGSGLPPVHTGPLPVGGPPPRRRVGLSIVSSVVVAIVIAVVFAADQIDWGGLTGDLDPGSVIGDALDGSSDADTGAALNLVHERQLSGASAVAAADGTAILAEVVDRQTAVSAVTPDGEALWTQTYDIEPTALALTVVEDLLVIDATASAADEGEDVRAVASLESGELLWKQRWSPLTRNDLAYYGTDVLVEQRDGFDHNAAIRIDLRTGEEVWSESGPDDDLFLIDEYRIRAATAWDEGQEAAGTIPPNSHSLYDNLVAGDLVVDLDPGEGTGTVRDAADGEAVTSGDLPVDSEVWTVFDDLVIGKVSDELSPSRGVLAAHSLSDLGETWNLDLDAGLSIVHVKACGPHLVCAAIDSVNPDDQYKTIAVDTQTGEQRWEIPVEWSVDDHWYSGPSGLVFGNQVFETVDTVTLLDFAGQARTTEDGSTMVFAMRDDRAVVVGIDTEGWHAAVADMATGNRTASAVVGADLPAYASIAGGLCVVLSQDLRALVFTVPEF